MDLFLGLAIILCLLHGTNAASASRTLCYSGSDLYQKITTDCDAQDPSYTGDWYCATMEMCESYISSSRTCIRTKGCAKAEQCCSDGSSSCSSSSGTFYDDSTIQTSAGGSPAGMTVKATCCKNSELFADDDSALDYTIICNSASRNGITAIALIAAVSVATFALTNLF
jgi:hypothetical protein